LPRPGNEQVDPFATKQDRPLEVKLIAQPSKRVSSLLELFEWMEPICSYVDDRHAWFAVVIRLGCRRKEIETQRHRGHREKKREKERKREGKRGTEREREGKRGDLAFLVWIRE
jgi:hypothetical protein